MDFKYLIHKSLPVLWWIAIWGLADMFIQNFVVNKKNNLIFFYVTMIAVVLGILYFDEKAKTHF